MRAITTHDTFVAAYDAGSLLVGWSSDLLWPSTVPIKRARDAGWRLRSFRTKSDFLRICYNDPAKFEQAVEDLGVDFFRKS